MKPEQSQNASMVSNRKKQAGKRQRCQASVITVKGQMKASASPSASQKPGLRPHPLTSGMIWDKLFNI